MRTGTGLRVPERSAEMGSAADDRPHADCPHCGMTMCGSENDGTWAMQFCPHCGMPLWSGEPGESKPWEGWWCTWVK